MSSSQTYQPVGRTGLLSQDFPQNTRTTVIVDSRDRNFSSHPTSSSFAIKLPEPLKNVSNAVLVAAEMPLSYYVFSDNRKNTSLKVVMSDLLAFPGAKVTRTASIPDGNYSTSGMASVLKEALDSAFSDISVTFAITFNPVDLKCLIKPSSGTISVDTTGATKQTEWGLGYYLGFERNVITPAASTAKGAYVASVNPENYMLIHIEELDGIHQNDMYGTGVGRKAFAKVPLNGDSYQYNYYDKTLTLLEIRPSIAKLDTLHISLRFHDGSLVDLNGAEWSMSLEFICTLTRMRP